MARPSLDRRAHTRLLARHEVEYDEIYFGKPWRTLHR